MRNLFKYLLVLPFLFPVLTMGQEMGFTPPDYKSIEKEVRDKNSEYYYPTLLQKLEESDAQLTEEDYWHLYYGYVFQSNYNPYGRYSKEKEMFEAMEGEETEENTLLILSMVLEALEEFPVRLDYRFYLAIAYMILENEEMMKKSYDNYMGLFQALSSSGDGENCETAYHVNSIQDEYAFLRFYDLQSTAQALIGECDLLSFPQETGVEGIYFNVSKALEKLNEMFE